MSRQSIAVVITLFLAVLHVAPAAEAPTPKSVGATNSADYGWLSAASLPQPSTMIDAAMGALPKTFSEKRDWLKRMHKAAWYPNLELRYGIGQGNYRRYQVLENRQRITTGTSSTRESSSQSGQSIGLKNNALGNNDLSLGSERSGDSTRSTTTSREVSDEGPASYVLSEDLRWMDDYGVYLSWDLSRLIFRSEEINVIAAEIDKETFRQDIRSQVIETYYDLKESLLLLDSETYKDSIPTRIRKERLAFLLDTLTGGALSKTATEKPK